MDFNQTLQKHLLHGVTNWSRIECHIGDDEDDDEIVYFTVR